MDKCEQALKEAHGKINGLSAHIDALEKQVQALKQALKPFAEKGEAAICVAHEGRIKPLPQDTMLSVCATIAEVSTACRALRGQGAEGAGKGE
jgi:predicted  nucleic acid-binding Zn-ribbon protein